MTPRRAGDRMRAAVARRPRRPRWSVRLRLTLLYGLLFLLSGAALLGITYGLVQAMSLGESTATNAPIAVVGPAGQSPIDQPRSAGTARGTSIASGAASAATNNLTPASASDLWDGIRRAESHQLLLGEGIALGVMAGFSILLGWVVAGRVLHPLRTITATTRAISASNLNQRLALAGPDDELKELGDTIDGLLARLEASFDAQRRFVANASHELRTPLAMMRTSLDVAVGKPAVPPEVSLLATKLREGLDQADRLVEELLTLARAQHRGLPHLTSVSLDRLAAAALESRRVAIEQMELTVQPSLAPASLVGSQTLLARMVANLIDNAVRHNLPGGFVRVATASRDNQVTLVVENGGPLLDASQVSLLGEPFQRLGTTRTASDGGVGLGLSIVAAVVAAHHGSLTFSARPEGGLRVAVELPVSGPEPDASATT